MKRNRLFWELAMGMVATVVLLTGCATLPPATPIKDAKSIAGTWEGTFTTTGGREAPSKFIVKPDGTYTIVRRSGTSSGTLKLLKNGQAKSARGTTWTLHEGEGKRILSNSNPRGTGVFTRVK